MQLRDVSAQQACGLPGHGTSCSRKKLDLTSNKEDEALVGSDMKSRIR